MPFAALSLVLVLTLSSCAARQPVAETPALIPVAEPAPELVIQAPAKEKAAPEAKPVLTPALSKWCGQIQASFTRYGWGQSRCEDFNWMHVRNSTNGTPLPWVVFGSEDDLEHKNVTLIMCGIHGDEITPVKFCFDIIYDLKDFLWDFSKRTVVIAPVVSPESFFVEKPTRTNGRGVDVNRNFPTEDWKKFALSLWKNKYRKDKRRFPGHSALSEPETVFQVNIIKRYRPAKIISVHSPLSMLDYDGPELKQTKAGPAQDLLLTMAEKAQGYKVQNYPYFPGSLGNWAGHELGIPTYTLELPNTNPQENERFWRLFREAIHTAIEEPMGPGNSN